MKSTIRRCFSILVFAVLAALIFASPLTAQAQSKVGVIDLDRAMKECKQGKKAMAALKLKAQKLETELKQEQAEIKKLQQDLENTAMLLKREARFSKEQEFQRKLRHFQERQRDANQEMLAARREVMAPILRNMVKVIKEMGAKGKYTIITEAKAAIYYPASVDITAQVIAAYDKAYP
jgi:outer membrane protein